ncbi:hypothetical protein CDAR_593851 [Caerostris darwini]|uniref:Uncharacterized protein n=1 Tax=Caerostris darwini TaxID=1538125 RepID=A0AAV4RNX5_9ARAC|nr:hypothetical protein CDAR_593851 [Caerostris darwini]
MKRPSRASHVQKKKNHYSICQNLRASIFHGCRTISYFKEQRYHVRQAPTFVYPKLKHKRACREFRTRAKKRDGFTKQEGTDGVDSQLLLFNSLQFPLIVMGETSSEGEICIRA